MCQPGMVVLRIDGTIVVAHSKKERGAPTFKKTFGHHPLGCWIDNTGELAALLLRAGNAGSDIDVAEITDLLRERLTRTGWPKNMRVIVRRTRLAPGEQPTLFQLDGYKHSCFVTNTGPGLSGQLLDARHRAHARVEDGVRTGKDTGLGHLPSKSWTVNLAWCHAVTIAVDLLAWLKLLGCPDIDTLNRAEPATLRYRLLHVPARLVRRARIRWLRVPRTWPWPSTASAPYARHNPTNRHSPPPRRPGEPKETMPAGATAGHPPYPGTTRHPLSVRGHGSSGHGTH